MVAVAPIEGRSEREGPAVRATDPPPSTGRLELPSGCGSHGPAGVSSPSVSLAFPGCVGVVERRAGGRAGELTRTTPGSG